MNGAREDVAAVVELIQRRRSEKHVPRLFVEAIPANLDRGQFKNLLARAGYGFGASWANQYVVRLSKADPSVQAVWEQGQVWRVTYAQLGAMAEK